MSKQTDIFISYRRDGGDMTAMYIYQALKDRGYDVFYDVEVLRAGKFNEALLEYIRSCKDFIIVLSPGALDRCSDEGDWVRLEIAEAIKENKNIIPVMMNGFSFPEHLPEDIASVRFHTGLTSSTEYFQESMNRLCEKFLTSKPRKKRNWLLPAAVVGAVIIIVLLINFLTIRKPPVPASTADTPPTEMSEQTEQAVLAEPEEKAAESKEPDTAHTLVSHLAVLPKEMEVNSSILSDDWLFTLPYENSWTLEYVNGPDLGAHIEEGQFFIERLPSQEGTTEYKAIRYGTDYRILLEAAVPNVLPEDAVLLDRNGADLNEQEIKVKAGEQVEVDCHFIPESWTFLDQEQVASIWCENGNADSLNWETNGTTGRFAITTAGQYKIGVKVNSGTVVAYRFVYVTVE